MLVHMPGRQIRVEGPVEKIRERRVGRLLDDAASREPDRGIGLDDRASRSSRARSSSGASPSSSRRIRSDIPRPAHWGGYRLFPETYEFWEHRENRLHDRLRYRRAGERWVVDRLDRQNDCYKVA